jgi:hypothetical protein
MSDIGERYAVPAEIDPFLDRDFLEVLTERPDRMTVEFHIPSRVTVDHRERITAYLAMPLSTGSVAAIRH